MQDPLVNMPDPPVYAQDPLVNMQDPLVNTPDPPVYAQGPLVNTPDPPVYAASLGIPNCALIRCPRPSRAAHRDSRLPVCRLSLSRRLQPRLVSSLLWSSLLFSRPPRPSPLPPLPFRFFLPSFLPSAPRPSSCSCSSPTRGSACAHMDLIYCWPARRDGHTHQTQSRAEPWECVTALLHW